MISLKKKKKIYLSLFLCHFHGQFERNGSWKKLKKKSDFEKGNSFNNKHELKDAKIPLPFSVESQTLYFKSHASALTWHFCEW